VATRIKFFRAINTNLEGCSISSQISYILLLDVFSLDPVTREVLGRIPEGYSN
jgi:hypothetical protein